MKAAVFIRVVRGAPRVWRWKKGRGNEPQPPPDRSSRIQPSPSGGVLLLVAALLPVHQPGRWNDEERRKNETEQRVEPHERDVETAQAYTDPQNGERTLAFHDELQRIVNSR